MSIKLLGLTTVITHIKKGRMVAASNVYIAIKTTGANIGVASAKLGGKYDETQALAEFKRNPQRFTLIQTGHDMAKVANLL